MSEITLSQVIGWNDPQSARAASQLDLGKDKLLAKFEVPWAALRGTLLQRLAEQLNIPCSDLLLGAWKKHEELQEFADEAKHPPGEINNVNLIDHEIEYEYPIALDVSFGPHRFPSVQLHLHVKLKLAGALLTIRDAKIVGIRPGSCHATAELKMSDSTLATAESGNLNLGDAYTLTKPIPLAAV